MFIHEILGLMIPIIAIVMGLGLAMVAVILNHRKRREMFALYHQERMAAIDKGLELPPLPEAFFSEDSRPVSPHRYLLKGLVWLFVGLGLLVALYFGGQPNRACFALIPTGIGLAYLIYYFAVGKREAEAFQAAQKARTTAPPRLGNA